MAASSQDLRCPSCGSPLGPLPPPDPSLRWVTCRHCGAPVPIAPAGPVPPRYTWEIYPGLYPLQPPLRRPRFLWRSVIVPVLLATAIVAFGIAGGSAYYGWSGSQAGQYTVSGIAQLSDSQPWVHGQITVTDESGTGTYPIGPGGAFNFTGIPTGGVQLNVTYPGYAPLLVVTFVSPAYDAGSRGLVLTLSPGPVSNESTLTLSPYPTLEFFQAYVGAVATIAAVVGILALFAAITLRRFDRPAIGIVGGASGAALPFALVIIPVGTVFPFLLLAGLVSGILGAFAFALAWIEIIQVAERPLPPKNS